ncbi:breast cancer type 1 susceptibility protein isoform X2 [Ambystoma mexicanum]|uniref:breast cancer type 1 susceptibility protein isoform X2 n=1 Tax=Ambystoma mexicanum TaxID=8296 RepID=UPI0037E87789
MSSSVLDMEEVHDVLSIMGKNLECPICLELMKEPVTTKCDHIFCRFCMLKLLNKKKRGRAECPMCKHEITKRSLQDSPRFKLLVEGLLKTIQAFELDTGHKFSCSPDKGMKAFEVCSSEQLVKDMGLIVHSTGYRRRRKRVSMDGQENLGLILETSSNVKLKKDLFQESPRRSKRQKLSSGKQVRLKSGSESSEEDLLEKAGSLRVGETDLLQTPDQGSDLEIEACEGCERETVDDPLSPRADAEEIILSDLAEYDFSERENESSRDVASRTEDFRTTASSLSEQNMPKNFGNAASNPLPRKCEGESNGAALQNDGECLSNKAKVPSTEVLSVTVMEKSPKRHSSGRKSKDCDLQEKEREASNQDHDCSYENESSLLHPDRSENSTPCSVSSKRVRTGVQRVTEWLSKLNEEMFALPPQDDYEPEVEALYTIRSKEKRHSGDSWASDKTEIMQNLLEVENCQSSSKPLLATIEDKIFGKTYKRERKSNPLLNISVLNDSKNIDDLAGDSVKECKDVRTPVLKRRRKLDLQPEDFIRRINTNDKNTSGICKGEAIVGQVPERKGVGAAFHFEVSPDDCTSKCNKSLDQPLLEDGCEYIVDRTIEQKDDPAAAVFNGCPLKCEVFDALSPGDITLVSETLKDKVKSNRTMMGPPIHAKDQTQAAQVKDLMSKRCKYQTQRVPALELVRRSEGVTDHEAVDTFSVLSSNNLIDLQIDSYPSSEERRKAKGGSISLRRSRRLLLQTEETSTLITLCNGSNKEEKPDQVNAGEDIVSGKEMTISVPSCSLSKVHVNLIDCNKLKSNGNHRKAGLHCEKQTLNHTPTDETALTDVKDLNTTMSEESIHWSPSELQNELEEANTQKSTSLLMVPPEQKDQMTYPLQNSHLIKEYSTCESSSDGLPITTSMDMILCGSKDLQHTKSQSPHINDSVLPVLSKEVDDSEQETELLLKTFKGAKRRSFILQPSPLPACTFEDPASPPSRDRTDTGQSDVKGKAPSSNYTQIVLPEDPLICADFQKATGYSSDHAETCGNTDGAAGCSTSICNTIKDNQSIPSQYPELHTPVLERNITNRSKKGLRRRGNLNVGSLSSLQVVESSFRNIFRDSCRARDLHNPDVIVQGTESHTINETEPSEGTERVDKASVGKNNRLALSLPPESMPLPLEVPHQNSATVCCKLTSWEARQLVNELAKSDCSQSSAFGKEQVNPRSCSDQGHEPGLTEFPKQPAVACGSGTNNTQVSSETPDGLLSLSNEARGNANFPELNIRCASVGLTGKTCDESRFAAGNLVGSSSGSSVPGLNGSTRRHPALKLFSSESSEEEELPCFQALLFAEAFNPSCDSGGPKNSADDSSSKQQGGGLVFSSSSACELKIHEDCSREGPASPSQQSECSVNLFSSQSNASEKSVTEDPKQSSTVTANQRKRALQANKNALVELEVDVCQDHEEESEVGNEEQNGQNTDQHLGEGSEYESEASHTGDSSGLSSQGEILTTQQRAIMQNNLEKLQKEMAVLQAVLEQNETQDLAVSSIPLQHNATDFPNGKVDSSEKSSSFTSKQDMEARSADDQLSVIPTFPCRREMEDVEYKSSPTPPPTPSRSQLTNRKTPEKVRHSMRLLKELKAAACAQDEDSQLVRVDQPEVPQEAEKSVDNRSEPVGFLAEKAAGTRRSSARVLSRLYENIGMTPSKPSPSALSSENNYSNSKDSLISPCITSKDRRRHSKRIERETGISTFVTPARVAAEPVMVKTPVVTNKRKISMVASGLNQSELLLVQKFSSKTKSTLSHQISDGTTHVIMKTDAELVCERTLKYFLGIAGRKWVVSYRWIVQCFKEGRILDEIDFEVRGDVINGRTHGGPRRARLSSENLLWKDFEICCSGSFTDMTTEHLEQMVTLCGGSVVKQPHLFTHDQFTAVLVVQPDACSEDTDFSAMKRKYNVTVVTREWMLDSVARYECQKFDAYLLPVS